MVVCGAGEHRLDDVLLPAGQTLDALAASALLLVFIHRYALDIAHVGEGEYALLLGDKILDIHFAVNVGYLCAALVAVFIPDGGQFVLEHALEHLFAGEQLSEVGYALLKLLVLSLELLMVETLESLEAHIKYRLCLNVVKREAIHQVFLSVVIAAADNTDNLVDIILSYDKTFEQMRPLERLTQVVLSPALDDILLEREVFVEHMAQRKYFRLLLVIDQSEHDYRECGLQCGLSIELVEHHLSVGVAFKLDDDTHTVPVRLVTQVGDALDALLLDLIGYRLDELTFLDHVGQLGDDDTGAVIPAEFLEIRPCTDYDLALAGGVCGSDAAPAHDYAPCREIRAFNVLHQILEGRVRVVQHADAGVDDFLEVVRRDARCHADRNARRTVDQQIRESGGEHSRLLAALVEVRIPIDGVLVDIAQHFVAYLAHASLGVPVGRRGVAVHGAEVAVAVNEHIAH